MIGLLVLSSLVASLPAGARTARLHEIQNRLGFSIEKAPTGTLARIQWTKSQYLQHSIPRSMKWDDLDWSFRVQLEIAFVRELQRYVRALGMNPYSTEPHADDGFIPLLGRWMAEFKRAAVENAKNPGYALTTGLAAQGVIRLRDWWRTTRPDAGKMSYTEAAQASHDWHRVVGRGFEIQAGTSSSTLPSSGGIEIFRWPGKAYVLRLVTAGQHAWEGRKMNHCVAGYWKSTRDGESVIFSLRDEESGSPFLTIEVTPSVSGDEPSRVVQVQGPGDTPPPESISSLLSDFIERFLHLNARRAVGRPLRLSAQWAEALRIVSKPLELALHECVEIANGTIGGPSLESMGHIFTILDATAVRPAERFIRNLVEAVRGERLSGWFARKDHAFEMEETGVFTTPFLELGEGSRVGPLACGDAQITLSLGVGWVTADGRVWADIDNQPESDAVGGHWGALVWIGSGWDYVPSVLLSGDFSIVDALVQTGVFTFDESPFLLPLTPGIPGPAGFDRKEVLLPHAVFMKVVASRAGS